MLRSDRITSHLGTCWLGSLKRGQGPVPRYTGVLHDRTVVYLTGANLHGKSAHLLFALLCALVPNSTLNLVAGLINFENDDTFGPSAASWPLFPNDGIVAAQCPR